MSLQIITLETPSKILKGWAEVIEVDGENLWSIGQDRFSAKDTPIGTRGHIVASKGDTTTIQVRNLYKIKSSSLKKGEWYNVLRKDDKWFIHNQDNNKDNRISIDLSETFDKHNKLKVVVQEVYEEDVVMVEVISFVDVRRKSGYSILDSTIDVQKMMLHTEYSGAITDKNLLSSLIGYYKTMKDQKKQAILGVTLNVETMDGTYEENELTFLAKTAQGFSNMGFMSTHAARNLIQDVPYLTFKEMKNYANDVVCIIPQESSELTQLISFNDDEMADVYFDSLKEIFGQNLYVSISKHDEEISDLMAIKLQEAAKRNNVKCVVGTDAHMVEQEDDEVHDVVRCIGLGITTDDETRFRYEGDYYHLLTPSEALEIYEEELIWNTLELAETLNVKIPLGNIHLPEFPLPDGFDSEEAYFKHLCEEGFNIRFEGTNKDNEEYRERLDFEIETILKMGFPGYFLIVADFMRFARENKILTGPGRGSACGSMVAYVMQITDVDPIEYGLLFERFLNPDRVSMPDYKLVV